MSFAPHRLAAVTALRPSRGRRSHRRLGPRPATTLRPAPRTGYLTTPRPTSIAVGSEPGSVAHSHRRPEEAFAPLKGRRVLAIWAHPDDESFLAAGMLASVAGTGATVVNLTATLGDAGTDDPAMTPERLAAIRHRELQGALRTLGPIVLDVLGLPDGDCRHVTHATGIRLVVAALRRHRPEVVVTFGPDGVTGHPDHRAVGHWTRRAVAAFDPEIAVLDTITSTVWDHDLLDPLDELGAFFAGPPLRQGRVDDLAVRLDDDLLDRKLAALGCHASQMDSLADSLGPDRYRRLFATEAFRPANPAAHRLLASAGPGVPTAA